jgi:hypothetical protein
METEIKRQYGSVMEQNMRITENRKHRNNTSKETDQEHSRILQITVKLVARNTERGN